MTKQTFTTGQVLTAAQMTSLQATSMGGGSPQVKTASYTLVAADAGTVIQMNNAGATTISVNQNLFAAGDSVQIQNIGAGVCTVTAGTATVTTAGSLALSQWEGGNLYFTSASASIFFDIVQTSGMTNPLTTTGDVIYSSSGTTPARLGIGTAGQVLNVSGGIPAWATASSGAMTVISSTTLSGATGTITFDSIVGTYTHLQIIYCVIGADDYMKMTFNNITTSTYYSQAVNMRGTTVGADEQIGVAFMRCGINQAVVGTGIIDIPNYKNTAIKKAINVTAGDRMNTSSNGTRIWSMFGTNDATTAITRIDITCASNFAIGSTFTLYGMS